MSLELDAVHAAHGVHGVTMSVAPGELLVVLGPSGAGKTTLLRVVAGLEPATSGSVSIGGRDVTRLRPGLRNVSMVFQSYALFPHLTVADNIAFGLRVRDVRRSEVRGRVDDAASTAGCAHVLDRRPHQISGGERQRVALARALVREPDVFLLDEPLSNLDAELRVEMRTELEQLHARVGGTMLYVTHDQTEAMVLGHRIAVMRDGVLEQIGTPEEIWRTPATAFVGRFVGTPRMNLVPAPLLCQPDSPADPVDLGFRPEAVQLHAVDDNATGIEVVVERVNVVGEDAHVYLRLADHSIAARVRAADRPAVGERLTLRVDDSDLHHFDRTGNRLERP